MAARKGRLAEKMLEEVVNYGGIPMRRRDVYAHALTVCGPRGADMFAFTPDALNGVEPWSMAEFEALCHEMGD